MKTTKTAIKREQRQAVLGYAERAQFGAKLKIFFMAALALMIAACSYDNEDLFQQPQKAKGITITAQLAPKSNDATTRAVSEGTNKIVAEWAVDEHLAILYEVSGVKKVADARIKSVDATTGAATIEFTVQDGTPDNTDCTLVYPLSSAKDDHSGVKDYATLLAAQDGTLNANLDVRVGSGTILITNPGLDVTSQPAAQFAIFKLTMKDIDGSADVSASSVVISNQSGTVTTVTPASGYDKVMYVALPTTATTLKFLVTGSNNTKYFNMASGLSLETKFYQSTVKLATVGNVIASNGKCYKNMAAIPGGNTAVAMITYLGNDAETNTTYRNGLALGLADVYSSNNYNFLWCSKDTETCLSNQYDSWSSATNDIAGIANTDALVSHKKHTHAAAKGARNYNGGTHPTGTSEWFLPSAGQWKKMQTAAGSYANLCNSVSMDLSDYYWSSTERTYYYAWRSYYTGTSSSTYVYKKNGNKVRACLAF